MKFILILLYFLIFLLNGGKSFIAEILFTFPLSLILLKEVYQKEDFFSSTRFDLPLSIFLLLIFFSSSISINPKVTLNSFLQIVNYLFFFYLLLYFLRENKNFENIILRLIVLLGILFSLFGIVQFFQGKAVKANLANSNLLASFLVSSLSIILSKTFFKPELRKKEKIINFVFILIFGFTFFLTRSRGGFLSLTIIFGFLLLFKYKRLILASVPVIIILFLLIFLPKTHLVNLLKINDPYGLTRINIWTSALKASSEKPLFGWGLGTFETVFLRYNFPVGGVHLTETISRYGKHPGFAMNEYLEITTGLGFLGLVCIIWLLYLFFKELYQRIKAENSWQTKAVFLGSTAILSHALVDFNLHLPLIVLTLIFFIAIGTNKSARPFSLPRSRFFLKFSIILLTLTNCSIFLSQYYLGKTEKTAGNLEKTVSYLRKATFLNPLDSLPHQQLADLYAEKYISTKEEKYREEVIKEYKKALKFDPENAFIYRSLGGFYYDYTENKNIGIFHYEKAIEKNPYNSFFYFELGKIYLNERVFHLAKKNFQNARELEPNYLSAYFEEGLLWERDAHLKEGNEEKALDLYLQVLQIMEKNPIPTTNYERKLLQFEPSLLYNQLAGIYFRKGLYPQALFYTKKALELEPKNKLFQQNLQLLVEKMKLSR